MRLNNSQVQSLLRCGTQYEFRYIRNIGMVPSFEMARGTFVHKAREKNLQQKIKSKHDLDVIVLLDESEKLIKSTEYKPSSDRLVMDKVVETGIRTDYDHFQRQTQPLEVESTIHVQPRGYDFELFGTLDLIDSDETIRDLKTRSRAVGDDFAHGSHQLTLYYLLAYAKGYKPKSAEVDLLVFNKYKVTPARLATSRCRDDITALMDRLQIASETIRKGRFLPAPEGSWYCSAKYCEYYFICPHITRAAKQHAIPGGPYESRDRQETTPPPGPAKT